MDRTEIRSFIYAVYNEMEAAGYGPEQQRSHLVQALNSQAMRAERLLLGEIMQSPMTGMRFIKSVQLLLGGVNEVILEREQMPIHITELTLATVTAAVEYFEKDFDTLYMEYTEGKLFE